jgi:RHS repeat-associated protein
MTATKNDPLAPSNPMRFTGEYLDPTGLYHLRARQYDTTIGRFTSTDPIESAMGSQYAYVSNRPTTFADPSGMISWGPCLGVNFFGFGEQFCVLVDDNLDVGISHTSTDGFQSPTGENMGGQFHITTADTIWDEKGPVAVGGASAPFRGPIGPSVDILGNVEGCPTDAIGFEIGGSLGFPPADVHGGLGNTNVLGVNVPSILWRVGSWVNPFG